MSPAAATIIFLAAHILVVRSEVEESPLLSPPEISKVSPELTEIRADLNPECNR
jgi:hypothetical protein